MRYMCPGLIIEESENIFIRGDMQCGQAILELDYKLNENLHFLYGTLSTYRCLNNEF